MTAETPTPTILVVDDDPGVVRLLERQLRREGYHTRTAQSGEEVLSMIAEQPVDLMVVDLKLPDMSGNELMNRLAARQQSVPFVVITGQGDERVAVEVMKQGALDYLVKDVDFLAFLSPVIHRTFDRLKQERRLQAAEESLKQEHAFISAVLDTSGALVLVVDPEGRIVRFNRACEQVTGYSFEEIQGKPVWELFIPEEEMDRVKAVFNQLQSGQRQNQAQNHWLTRNGERRLITWSNVVLTDDQGGVEHVVATGIDISEHKRLEKEISEASELEQRRIGQDLHDGLCQHLAGIEFMSQLLAQQLDDKAKTHAESAQEIARLIREAIAHTRDLSRGLSPVMETPDGLMSALKEMTLRTENLFRVECVLRCTEPVMVHDNLTANHMYRIAQEAVTNAVRHGKAKRVEIQLHQNSRGIHLEVRDNGKGMPDPLPARSGMGLRIMQYRAGMFGGVVNIRNLPKGGTQVLCKVPVVQTGEPGTRDGNQSQKS